MKTPTQSVRNIASLLLANRAGGTDWGEMSELEGETVCLARLLVVSQEVLKLRPSDVACYIPIKDIITHKGKGSGVGEASEREEPVQSSSAI